MSTLRLIDIETRRHHVTLVLSTPGNDGRYVARYCSTPRYSDALYSRSEKQISGSVAHDNADAALYMAFSQIETADGPVLAVEENTFTGEKVSLLPDLRLSQRR